MGKQKTSAKRAKSSEAKPEAIPTEGVNLSRFKAFDAGAVLRDRERTVDALIECLLDGDAEAFKEILKTHYEAVNKAQALKRIGMSARTFYQATSEDGNPTLDKVMMMMKGLNLDQRRRV